MTRRQATLPPDYFDGIYASEEYVVRLALRKRGSPERDSFITHAKGPNVSADDRFVDMNAYGFAKWYIGRTPFEYRLAKAYHDRWLESAGIKADAEVSRCSVWWIGASVQWTLSSASRATLAAASPSPASTVASARSTSANPIRA